MSENQDPLATRKVLVEDSIAGENRGSRTFTTHQEEGFSMVEYGLLLGLLALGVVGVISTFGARINSLCSTLGNSL
jgi:Flp pilus assembly pilin Flp